jgi:hypothetical protein
MTLQTVAGRAVGGLAAAALIAFQFIGATRQRWAVQIPDDAHSYGIRFKGGVDLFFTPAVGWFLDHGLWIFVAIGLAAVVAEWIGRIMTVPESRQGDFWQP